MSSTADGNPSRGRWRRSWRLGAVVVACLAWATSAQGKSFAYVADVDFLTVSQYGIGAGGLLSPLSPATVASGSGATGVAVTPDGKSVYVTAGGDNLVDEYAVDPVSGGLSPKASASAGFTPNGIVVSPDGKSAYVANTGDVNHPTNPNVVSQYDIDPVTGVLSLKTPGFVTTGRDSTAIAVTPDGKSVYVTNAFINASMVSQYTVDPVTGALSPKTPATVATDDPTAIAVTPDGKNAYVTNIDANTVSQYTVNPVSGALSPKTPATVAAGALPVGLEVSPDGKSVYVTDRVAVNVAVNGTVSQFNVDPVTGALSPKTPATAPAGLDPHGVAVTPDGKSAYVTNTNFFGTFAPGTVSQYDINPVTGALSPKTPDTVAAGFLPLGIAVTPLPRPTSKAQCKNGGWRNFPQFKNQGDCVSFVNNGR